MLMIAVLALTMGGAMVILDGVELGETSVSAAAPAPMADAGGAFAAQYPEFVAGLNDCLSHLIDKDPALLASQGAKLGNDTESYAIFYPEFRQPHDFVVSVTSVNGDYSCSGQGPVSLPSDQVEPETDALAALFAARNMVQLNFPAPNAAFADCEADIGMILTDNAGTVAFAGFAGQNATTYCTAFGPKQ